MSSKAVIQSLRDALKIKQGVVPAPEPIKPREITLEFANSAAEAMEYANTLYHALPSQYTLHFDAGHTQIIALLLVGSLWVGYNLATPDAPTETSSFAYTRSNLANFKQAINTADVLWRISGSKPRAKNFAACNALKAVLADFVRWIEAMMDVPTKREADGRS